MSVTSAMLISMHTRPTTFARRPRINTWARLEYLRLYPSAYPIGSVAITDSRGARQVLPYEIGVPAATRLTWITAVLQASTGSSAAVPRSQAAGYRP